MQELTKAQQDYFKDSRVRGSDGKLIVCYHNTANEFDAFDKSKINCAHNTFYGRGFYFSTSDKYDETFGEKYKGCFGEIKHECYINMKNPLVIDDVDILEAMDILEYLRDNHPDYGKPDGPPLIAIDISEYPDDNEYKLIPEAFRSEIFFYGAWKDYADQLTAYAKENGYDGIIQQPLGLNQPTEIVVFEPNQIKLVSNLYPTQSDNFKDNSNEYLQNPDLSFEERAEIARTIKEYVKQNNEDKNICAEKSCNNMQI